MDTHVYLREGNLETDLYTKPTDTHQYLLTTSCHPKHCKDSIPYSQALRLRRICSKEETFQTRLEEMKQHFLHRGYNRETVESQMQKAANIPREESLQPQERRVEQRTPLITTYDPRLPPLSYITKRNHHILQLSDRLKRSVPVPPMIAYRRPRNLRDLLVRADLKPPLRQPPGNRPCGGCGCKTCPMLLPTDCITSPITGITHQIKVAATCKTTNVVYVIQCQRCSQQYVGETEQALHERINSHRSDVRLKKLEKPVAAHFNSLNHTMQDMRIVVVERIRKEDIRLRRLRESHWIATLNTLHPSGMNREA